MIRKQLYITLQQERALKERAYSLFVSEAEVVRAALDAAFGLQQGIAHEQEIELERFLEATGKVRGKRPANATLDDPAPYDGRRAGHRRFVYPKRERR